MNYQITLTEGPQFIMHKFKHLSLILFSLPCAYPIVTNFKRTNGRHVVQHRKNLIML
ncbi:hypothetical protein BT93_C1198 [Corymbia citriodora subsp. variegata]|nr:hypothetical protein BT93_C1198 [Corymbia citriodora subsp. variegata]